jgi:hypothetical protein
MVEAEPGRGREIELSEPGRDREIELSERSRKAQDSFDLAPPIPAETPVSASLDPVAPVSESDGEPTAPVATPPDNFAG